MSDGAWQPSSHSALSCGEPMCPDRDCNSYANTLDFSTLINEYTRKGHCHLLSLEMVVLAGNLWCESGMWSLSAMLWCSHFSDYVQEFELSSDKELTGGDTAETIKLLLKTFTAYIWQKVGQRNHGLFRTKNCNFLPMLLFSINITDRIGGWIQISITPSEVTSGLWQRWDYDCVWRNSPMPRWGCEVEQLTLAFSCHVVLQYKWLK